MSYQTRIKYIFLLILAASAGTVWYRVFTLERADNMRVTVFDVGQGDAIFLEFPGGAQVLIDGGPSSAVLAKLGRRMPLWDRSIDLVILTHPHTDHLAGLVEVLKRYEVGAVIESGVWHEPTYYDEWQRVIKEKNIRRVIAVGGMHVQFSPRVYLDILSPMRSYEGAKLHNVHEAMITALFAYGTGRMLLTGDAERGVERELAAVGRLSDVDVLKVGHHGSKTSSSAPFLRAVTPEYAVVSSGRGNRYGHPHTEVIDRLASFDIAVIRTDRDGDVVFESEGGAFTPAKKDCFFWCGMVR